MTDDLMQFFGTAQLTEQEIEDASKPLPVLILDVTEIKEDLVLQCDGDGFHIENKDGTERYRRCVVLA